MAEFKRLSDVEVVAEPVESANVLIEENGVIKKTAMNGVGSVKSVNGVPPDEDGNVEIQIETVTSWNDLEDRPFGDIAAYSPCFEEQTVTFTTNTSNDRAYGYMTRTSNVPWDAICRVVFDGIVYDNIAAYESGGDMCVHIVFTTEDGNEIDINSEESLVWAPAALAGEHTVAVYAIMINTLQIDKKFLPDTIEDTDIILNSSTSGSTKRFKITVDDSGVLTAVEVTD